MAEDEATTENEGTPTPPESATEAAVAAAAAEQAAPVRPVEFGDLPGPEPVEGRQNLDLLLDVSIPVSVEVGRAEMNLAQILDLVPGSVVPLDKRAEEPVDLRVNGKLVARGEVVLVDDTYGLRVTQIIDPAGRIETLRQ